MIEYNKRNIRVWSMLGQRRTIGVALDELAEIDDKLTFITADTGRYNQIDRFLAKHKDKYVNVGIAEQNMICVAAGMAKEGYDVFACSYATFITSRVLDQVRTCMGIMQLPIILIGGGGGFAEGALGPTHMGLEDVSNMRSIPGMTIVEPADCMETMKVMEAAVSYHKPLYIRLTGNINMPPVYTDDYEFKIGKSVPLLQNSTEITLLASGASCYEALKAAKMLKEQNIDVSVYNMHTIKPLDKETLDKIRSSSYIFCIEEHEIIGGLYSAVAEYYCETGYSGKLIGIGVDDCYPNAGYYPELVEQYGLSAEKIYDKVLAAV